VTRASGTAEVAVPATAARVTATREPLRSSGERVLTGLRELAEADVVSFEAERWQDWPTLAELGVGE